MGWPRQGKTYTASEDMISNGLVETWDRGKNLVWGRFIVGRKCTTNLCLTHRERRENRSEREERTRGGRERFFGCGNKWLKRSLHARAGIGWRGTAIAPMMVGQGGGVVRLRGSGGWLGCFLPGDLVPRFSLALHSPRRTVIASPSYH